MATAKLVYDIVVDYFAKKCGGKAHVSDHVRIEKAGEICLLRAACMGNPERTMQGELFAHLRNHSEIVPVLEYRYHRFDEEQRWRNGRSIDIMVFDKAHEPIVAIELKHHSRQQGSLKPLLDNLKSDREKLIQLEVPVIQIGLYTELTSIPDDAIRDDFLNFRFITAYAYTADAKLRLKQRDRRTPITDSISKGDLEQWVQEHFHLHTLSLEGRPESFQVQSGANVTGRVHYIVGLSSA